MERVSSNDYIAVSSYPFYYCSVCWTSIVQNTDHSTDETLSLIFFSCSQSIWAEFMNLWLIKMRTYHGEVIDHSVNAPNLEDAAWQANELSYRFNAQLVDIKMAKYLPNNWDAIESLPTDQNYFPELTYEEFMDWRVAGFEIPSSIDCIIRAESKQTGEITEHVYRSGMSARKRLFMYKQSGDHHVVMVNTNAVIQFPF